jgi:hypothetical protein
MPKIKHIILFLFFFELANCYCQTNSKKVSFEVFESENQPLPGANIRVKDSKPSLETQTDLNGKAELNLENLNVDIELSILGPYITFKLIENIDLIKVNIKKQKVEYYSKNRILKKRKLKIKGY